MIQTQKLRSIQLVASNPKPVFKCVLLSKHMLYINTEKGFLEDRNLILNQINSYVQYENVKKSWCRLCEFLYILSSSEGLWPSDLRSFIRNRIEKSIVSSVMLKAVDLLTKLRTISTANETAFI